MVRAQIIALSLGAGIAVAGGVLLWEGVLPGLRPRLTEEAPQKAEQVPPISKPSGVASKTANSTTPISPAMPAPAPTKPAVPVRSANSPAASPPVAEPQKQAAIPAPEQSASAPKIAPLPVKPEPQAIVPQFDTVRVEPTGDTVVAGHAAPESNIDLLADEKVIGSVKAGDAGDFVIVPDALAPGSYVLALRSRLGHSRAIESRQTITVSVPEKGQKGVVVALTEPGKPSKLLIDPTARPPAAKPEMQAKKPEKPEAKEAEALPKREKKAPGEQARGKATVTFKTAEASKGAFYATGAAPPGTHLRIYLNGSLLAEVTADAAGQWSMTIGKGMVAGHYEIRADAIAPDGKVVARAEVPFDMPAAVQEANRSQEAAAPKSQVALTPKSKVAEPPKTQVAAAPKTKVAAAPKTKIAAASAPATEAKPAPAVSAPAPQEQASSEPPAGAWESRVRPLPVSATAPPKPTAADAVVPEIDTATVTPGDSLWRISRKTFGHGIRYMFIYAANASQIRNPNLIYPGQVFVLPHAAHRPS